MIKLVKEKILEFIDEIDEQGDEDSMRAKIMELRKRLYDNT